MSVRDGLELYVSSDDITYVQGCQVSDNSTNGFGDAVNAARNADLTILVVGLDQSIEAETLDRDSVAFPGVQSQLIQQVSAAAKNTIVVILSGGCVDTSNFTDSSNTHVNAVIWVCNFFLILLFLNFNCRMFFCFFLYLFE